jgi:FMN reductase [NAD(P)H]
MEFRELLRRRRMVRSFRPDEVDPEVLERIVRTVRRAPTAGFSQGVRLLVVTDPETRRQVAEIVGGGEWTAWIATVPVHIAVLVREEDYHERYRERDKVTETGEEIEWPVPYWYVDAGGALVLLLLAAIDEGFAGGFFGALPPEAVEIKQLLGVPEDVSLVGVVTIGREAADPEHEHITDALRRRRRPLAEIVHWERWDGPA